LVISPDPFDGNTAAGIVIGDLNVDTCAEAVSILDKRMLNGKKAASNPAFNLAAQLLAYRLNILAGAGDLSCAHAAAVQAQGLLDAVNFNGNGPNSVAKSTGATMNNLARILDQYNNNILVCT
jgi:hypothetical protein